MDSFQRDGLTFDVRDGGPVDGEPVVLLHGFPQDSAAWNHVAPTLHQAGLRTLAPDQRGCSPMARLGQERRHFGPRGRVLREAVQQHHRVPVGRAAVPDVERQAVAAEAVHAVDNVIPWS